MTVSLVLGDGHKLRRLEPRVRVQHQAPVLGVRQHVRVDDGARTIYLELTFGGQGEARAKANRLSTSSGFAIDCTYAILFRIDST